MGLFNFPLFASETKEATFWRWFQKNDERLFSFEKDREKTFDSLAEILKKVNPNLTFEFGPIVTGSKREFVISAGGIRSAFPAVEALHAAAPQMPKWIFIKFRARRTSINDLEYSGVKVRAKDVNYILFKDENPEKVGILIFIDGYTKERKSTFGQIGYLFLDEALGEYDVEMKVGAIQFESRESKYFERSHPLPELPQAFDEHFGSKKE